MMFSSTGTLSLPDDYLPFLEELNEIVRASGAPVEGNLYYEHHEPDLRLDTVTPRFAAKRANIAAAARNSRRMLEIGLNAGHSALLALSRGVELHSVDICAHAYTRPVADFLALVFGDRFHFYPGDSLEVLPRLHAENPQLTFDCFHIDGNHGLDFCRADMHNAYSLAEPGAWMVIDDTDLDYIDALYLSEVREGRLLEAAPPGWIASPYHRAARITAAT